MPNLYNIRGVESWFWFGLGRLVGLPPGDPSSPPHPPASPRPRARLPIPAGRRAADRRRTPPRLRRGSPPAARPQPRDPRPWSPSQWTGCQQARRPAREEGGALSGALNPRYAKIRDVLQEKQQQSNVARRRGGRRRDDLKDRAYTMPQIVIEQESASFRRVG